MYPFVEIAYVGTLSFAVVRYRLMDISVVIKKTVIFAILSGFIFDIRSMPLPIRLITHLIAARYFVETLQTVFLAGNVWRGILPNALALIIMSLIFLGISRRKFRKRLE